MNKLIPAIAALLVSGACFAQVGTAIKDSAKATVDTGKQAKENVQAATSSEPAKSVHKAKAKVHKTVAQGEGRGAKAAAKAVVQ